MTSPLFQIVKILFHVLYVYDYSFFSYTKGHICHDLKAWLWCIMLLRHGCEYGINALSGLHSGLWNPKVKAGCFNTKII